MYCTPQEALRLEQIKLDEEKKTKAGEMLVYNACSEGSNMAGKILLRGEGVSFEVIDFLDTVILRPPEPKKREPPLTEGQNVQVLYHGQAPYRGKIVHFTGHDMYSVRYDIDNDVETGVLASRLTATNLTFRLKVCEAQNIYTQSYIHNHTTNHRLQPHNQ